MSINDCVNGELLSGDADTIKKNSQITWSIEIQFIYNLNIKRWV